MKERYNFKCVSCGYEQSFAPSLAMTMGINTGRGSCSKCKTFYHLEISEDDQGVAMLWDEYLKMTKEENKNELGSLDIVS